MSGSFSLATNPDGHGFMAAAGQCVTGTDVNDPTTGSFFTQWTVGVCQ